MSTVWWDGERLAREPLDGGRCLEIDARCTEGVPVEAWAHVCVSVDDAARVRFDEPEVQQARRDALAWWIGLLADDLVCLTTCALDASWCAGAITVAHRPDRFDSDPFARLFAGRTVRCDVFSPTPPPPGPLIERVAGAPWPEGLA
ncbi:MAG: hypothetical protein WKF96_23670 [Solirubrobacteraceae bacterium]